MFRPLPFLVICGLFLSACAASANHDVISPDQPWDDQLDCAGIEREIKRARTIIRGVERDEASFSAADLIDAALYFPFNVLIKNRNYHQAKSYAHTRIMRLQTRSSEKHCSQQVQQASRMNQRVSLGSPLRKTAPALPKQLPRSQQSTNASAQPLPSVPSTGREARKTMRVPLAKTYPYTVIRLADAPTSLPD